MAEATLYHRTDAKEDWLTPPELVESLGFFDLDPCAAVGQPWKTAKKQYTIEDNGLLQEWNGRVWCNPPYGRKTQHFMNKLKGHGDGIALIFTRTETKNWFENIWTGADAILFLRDRISFHDINGVQKERSGCGSALIAYGQRNVQALEKIKNRGSLIYLKGKKRTMRLRD